MDSTPCFTHACVDGGFPVLDDHQIPMFYPCMRGWWDCTEYYSPVPFVLPMHAWMVVFCFISFVLRFSTHACRDGGYVFQNHSCQLVIFIIMMCI
jgi:hypothetical protein